MKKRTIIIGSIILCITFTLTSVYLLFFKEYKNRESYKILEPQGSMTPDTNIAPSAQNVTPEIKDLKRWPTPTISPVMKSTDKTGNLVPIESKPLKRYLMKNPLKINEIIRTNNIPSSKVELKFPQIDGLIDISIQNKINEDIEGYANKLLENASLYKKDLLEVRLSYNITANYNNVLCVNLYQNVTLVDNSIFTKETLLYELVNGEKLELKDIFARNTDFPGILNKAIDEYFMKKNLEESMLSAPFKGIREGQGYELTDSNLNILVNKNDEVRTYTMVFGPIDIRFRLYQFSGLIDIYDKYANPGKKIYQTNVTKKKMLPNNFEVKYIEREYIMDNYRALVNGIMFTGMKNSEIEKKLNADCFYTGENEFKKKLPENIKKTTDINEMPVINRYYGLMANYCDVLSIVCNEHYTIPGIEAKDSAWHINYNVLTGTKLELQDIFKEKYDWKKSIITYIREEAEKRRMELTDKETDSMIKKADFWFDEEKLWLNLKPEEYIQDQQKNTNIFSIPFEYLGEENLSIRE